MQIIEINTSLAEQSMRIALDGVLCSIRVYWSENQPCMGEKNGEDGQFYVDVISDLFTVRSLAITMGSEFFFPYGQAHFGGFIAVDNKQTFVNPDFNGDWALLYVPLDEVGAIREVLNAV